MIKYFLDHSSEFNWRVRVGDMDLSVAKEKIGNHSNGEAVQFDALNPNERAKEIGADFVINYNKETEWWKKVQEITNKKGADIIVEVGGSKTLEQSIKCSKTGAVIGIIGVLSGGIAKLPIGRVIYKASRLIGISCGNKMELTNMIEKFNTSKTKPIIDSIFKFSDLQKALFYMSKGRHLGKIAIDFEKK